MNRRESYLLYIETNDGDPGCLWTGVGWLDLAADRVLPVPTRFLGGGNIISLPDFQQLINGVAERLSAGVSGVSIETMRIALEQAEAVKGATTRIGRVTFDQDWQVKRVAWIGEFRADVLETDRTGDGQRTITISIGTENTDRSKAPIAMFTPADQRRRSPTDRMMDNVPSIQQGTSRRFGLKDGK